ncbi:MAG: protein-glutamate O-methyltransferase CheR [Planctomycetes bacterium]|nr:protein-glutamate O-methyltransferase CheR [Planctomycetota bacterium]
MALSQAAFEFARTLVRQRSGIVLENEKAYLVESRLTVVARNEGFASVDLLLEQARTQPLNGLQVKVVEAMTTNETSFFRDVQPFEALRQLVLPDLIKRRAQEKQLTIWCGAASTGQEPYSLAILLREHFPILAGWKVNILATDLSLEILERAKRGRYSQVEVNRGLSARLLVKFFDKQGLEWQLKEDIRRLITFRQLNLIEAWPWMAPADVILVRNVLIYFDVETKKAILGKVKRLLRPDGFLFLGGAETTMNLDDGFDRVEFERAGCYRLRKS